MLHSIRLTIILAMGIVQFEGIAETGQTDQGNSDVQVNVTGLKTGVVTDVMTQTVGINGKVYGVTTDVVVVNQFGKTDGLDSVRRNLQVYFHVREDNVDKKEKIDRMVLVIPQ